MDGRVPIPDIYGPPFVRFRRLLFRWKTTRAHARMAIARGVCTLFPPITLPFESDYKHRITRRTTYRTVYTGVERTAVFWTRAIFGRMCDHHVVTVVGSLSSGFS